MNQTTRDRVWVAVLNNLYRDGETMTPAEVSDLVSCSERTARETIKVMEANGFVRMTRINGKVAYTEPSGGL